MCVCSYYTITKLHDRSIDRSDRSGRFDSSWRARVINILESYWRGVHHVLGRSKSMIFVFYSISLPVEAQCVLYRFLRSLPFALLHVRLYIYSWKQHFLTAAPQKPSTHIQYCPRDQPLAGKMCNIIMIICALLTTSRPRSDYDDWCSCCCCCCALVLCCCPACLGSGRR